jgi:hypothetical protein
MAYIPTLANMRQHGCRDVLIDCLRLHVAGKIAMTRQNDEAAN